MDNFHTAIIYKMRFLDQDWIKCTGFDPYLQVILNGRVGKGLQKKQYGILDFPSIPPGVAEVTFGIEIDQRSCVELSNLGSFLDCISPSTGKDNAGLHLNNIYWPFKAQNENICLFKLKFWECNDHYFKRFSYISSVIVDSTNIKAVLIHRSNRNSLDYVRNSISETSRKRTPLIAFVTGGEYGCQITDQELFNFSRENNIPILGLPSQYTAVDSVKLFYHSLCDFLYGLRFSSTRFSSSSRLDHVLPVVSQST